MVYFKLLPIAALNILAFLSSSSINASPTEDGTFSIAGPKFGGVFLADQRLDGIYLLRDLDGNGDAEAEDEATLYFNNNDDLGNPFTVHTGQSGYVYVGDGDQDAVFRLEDINHDGDALDDGESSIWFSAAGNDAGFTLPTPNGVWETNDGDVAVYIVNAGTGSQPDDYVLRTQDLDGDGNANGPGEAIVWCNLGVLVSELLNKPPGISSAFEIVFIGDIAYIADSAGGNFNILSAQDTNGNGVIDSGELRIFLSLDNNDVGVTDFFTALTKIGPDLITSTFIGPPTFVWFLNDIDGSGTIDKLDEVNQVWNGLNTPPGKNVDFNFGIAGAQIGTNIYTASNDGDGGVFRLVDSDGDGKYDSPGEVITFRSISEDTTNTIPAVRPRNVEVLPEFFQAKGYYGVSNVDKQNDLPFDLQTIALQLETFSDRPPEVTYANILAIYEDGGFLPGFSFAGFADGTDALNPVKSFNNIFPEAVEYFGSENFLDTYIRGAITGTGPFENSNDNVRSAAIISGIYSLLNYFVNFELRFSQIKADDNNFGCPKGAPHNFDEAIAFFYGPRGQSSLFAFFDELQKDAGIAGKSSVTCEPYFEVDVNAVIVNNFIRGIDQIAPHRPLLGSDECVPPSEAVFPTLEAKSIELILFRTFLVACAQQSRDILSNNFNDREFAITFVTGLYLLVAPGVFAFAPDADETIKLQFDLLSIKPCSNIIPGATLVDTFDRLIEQIDNPTQPPTPDPTVAPTPEPTPEPTPAPTRSSSSKSKSKSSKKRKAKKS